MEQKLKEITKCFQLDGSLRSFERYGCGHINTTWLLYTERGTRYILQKINRHVFRNVPALMQNVEAVTCFLAQASEDPRGSLRLVPTALGFSYHQDEEGEYWRIYRFVEDSICLQQARTPADFYESAIAFGTFQQMLKDFPVNTLTPTIPRFHDTADRYRIFRETLAADPMGRAAQISSEIAFALEREGEADAIVSRLVSGALPLRVTHNDTKLNNVMLDAASGRALCVIDLDTVMAGSSLYDFGDSIRFGAASAAEDEQDLDRVEVRLDLFEIFTRGYLKACPDLTELERKLLPLGAKLMTLECGVRFLTDYLDGDHYFAIHRPSHNLDRCRTQFRLVSDMERKWEALHAIVEAVSQEMKANPGDE